MLWSFLKFLPGHRARKERRRIYESLVLLSRKRIPLEIEGASSPAEKLVYLYDVDWRTKTFGLNMATVGRGIPDFAEGQMLTLSTVSNEFINCRFSVSVLAKNRFDPNLMLFNFPHALAEIEHRHAFRVKATQCLQVELLKNNDAATSVEGQLHDISFTGLAILFSGDHREDLPTGHTFQFINEDIHADSEARCFVHTVRAVYDPQKNETLIGGEFLAMDEPLRKALGTFITKLQRREK